MNLYNIHAKKFSETRQSPWKGWDKLYEDLNISPDKHYSILDLGCGNGRFLKYLLQTWEIHSLDYTGLDNSKILINIAKASLKEIISPNQNRNINAGFLLQNLEGSNWKDILSSNKFDIVVGFGLMHHLQTYESRRNLLISSRTLLKDSGFIVLTYWQFAKLNRYKKMMRKPEELGLNIILSENDYLLTFGREGAYRFCHFYSNDELKKLEVESNLKSVDQYFADGKENDQNLYIVYKKNE